MSSRETLITTVLTPSNIVDTTLSRTTCTATNLFATGVHSGHTSNTIPIETPSTLPVTTKIPSDNDGIVPLHSLRTIVAC